MSLDKRLNAYRDDLADIRLEGQVQASRYVAGHRGQIRVPFAPMFREPRLDAERMTEALAGEIVSIFDRGHGWAWCQLQRDGYVGYLPESAVMTAVRETTHRVAVNATFMYAAPDIKAEVLSTLSLNAEVSAVDKVDRFVRLQSGAFVIERHLAERGTAERDFVAVAERFLGVPYLWGGRTSAGLDCSGLVQMAMLAAGLDCPRDSDMQQVAVGKPMALTPDLAGIRRGDLLFWKGHVGIVTDGLHLLHANAFHMQVAKEPIMAAVARNGMAGLPLSAVKRPVALGTDKRSL